MQHSILVVDDEPLYCSSIQFLLETNHYRVRVASTGREALSFLQTEYFHAVLLDLNLPDIDGIQVAEYIRQNHYETAIIIQTGYATVNNAIQAMRYGVFDFLCKPNKAELVLETIARGIENKRLKWELTQSEKRFRKLSEATWEGIAIFENSRLLYVNGQLCKLFGYDEAELFATPFSEIIPEWDACTAAREEGEEDTTGAIEFSSRHKDGRIIPVELRIKYIDGRKNLVVAIRDISMRKIAEDKRLELLRKLADAKRMESLGLMASSVAHDLNNILSGIVTFPELLLTKMSPTDAFRPEIELIHNAGRQAAGVVADLLTVARGSKCKKEPNNLNLLVRNFVTSIEYRQLQHDFPGMVVDVGLEPDLPNLKCSTIHLSKSITNLVTNAAEACDDDGYISIRTISRKIIEPIRGYEEIPPGDYVVLSVSDNGSGIPAEGISRIFEPFYSKKEMGRSGTGLGLTVIWNTVRDHHGFIDLASNRAGSRFELYFPVSEEKARAATDCLLMGSLLGKGEKILIVDDEESQRSIACSILRQLGYVPFSVDNGRSAVEYLKREHADLVLLDMIMEPGMDGCETFSEILRFTPKQKAVITSGHWSREDQEKIRLLGISQYITKPYSLACIARAIRSEIDGKID
jgi:two-component system, cell cycle sensor histidine kinase and response regulator CckA